MDEKLMEFGMLWYGGNLSPSKSIEDGIAYFKEKYGIESDLVFMNPRVGKINPIVGVEFKLSSSIRPSYYWIGIRPNGGRHG